MTITAPTQALAAALAKIAPVAQGKTTLPILSCVLVTGMGDRLRMRATDLEVTAETEVHDVECDGQPCFAVNAAGLLSTLKGLRGDTVTLRVEGDGGAAPGWLRVTCGKANARMPLLPVHEFPKPADDDGDLRTVDAGPLSLALSRCLPFVSRTDDRTTLTGINIDGTRAASTDGHRMAIAPVPQLHDARFILSHKGAQMAVKLLGPVDECEAGVVGSAFVLRCGDDVLSARLIDGVFPNIDAVIPDPRAAACRFTVASGELVDRLRFVAKFASAKTHNVTLRADGDTLTLAAQDADKGECKETMALDELDLPNTLAGYNHAYLDDAIRACMADAVEVGIRDSLSPTTIRPVVGGEPVGGVMFVVMPMRV